MTFNNGLSFMLTTSGGITVHGTLRYLLEWLTLSGAASIIRSSEHTPTGQPKRVIITRNSLTGKIQYTFEGNRVSYAKVQGLPQTPPGMPHILRLKSGS